MRTLIGGLVAVILVLGFLLVLSFGSRGIVARRALEQGRPPNVLADSRDACVTCHRKATPGIVEQYGTSRKAVQGVSCRDCHEVKQGYPGSVEHEGTWVLATPTTAVCEKCHGKEVREFYQSRHALPAYVAYAGTQGLSPDLLEMYRNIPEGGFQPDRSRNALFALEGPEITRFACQGCHDIGKPAPDGSVGDCSKCHLRHEFSLEQARKPETCNACHIGPDHPQWEIYQESPHGIAYLTRGHTWNWDAKAGTLTPADFPAPTCAICHMSGFGGTATTHDVGDRLTWFLFAPVSKRRPAWQDNRARMQTVCRACHNKRFVEAFYEAADQAVMAVNRRVEDAQKIMNALKSEGLLTPEPFDEPIDFVYFDLWHHWGRTAKFGVWMQGPDYVQWHGIYELLKEMAELRKLAEEKRHMARK